MPSKAGGSGWSCLKVTRVEVKMKRMGDGWAKRRGKTHSRRFLACKLFLLELR